MPAEVLDWLAVQVGDRCTVASARSLHGGESPWWVDVITSGRTSLAVVLRFPSSRIDSAMIATNAAALTVAERFGLPAPRLLAADLTARAVGMPITVESAILGGSAWPVEVSPDLLRDGGAAVAAVHAIAVHPQPALPFRPRPIAVDDFAAERRSGRMPSTALLDRADEQLSTVAMPEGPSVFVHGDVWPGNIVLVDGRTRTLIDWKKAGVGHPGVDLGELRKQVAIAYGLDAPRYVLEGWERAAGTKAQDVPFWDATAALNTPTESNGPADAVRRDEFLSAALALL